MTNSPARMGPMWSSGLIGRSIASSSGVRSIERRATTSSSRPCSAYRLLTPRSTTTSSPKAFAGRNAALRLPREREVAEVRGEDAAAAEEEDEEDADLSVEMPFVACSLSPSV